MYRFILDGIIQPTEAIGWDTLTTTLKRDRKIQAILKTQDGTFQFWKSSFDYVYGVYNSQSFCSTISIEIQRSKDGGNIWTNFYTGIIYTKDVIFDHKRGYAIVRATDNSYYAWIENNKSTDCLPHVAFSKNGEDITAYLPSTKLLDFYTPSTGNYANVDVRAYTIYDTFKYLIAFMTDGNVEFDSDPFGVGGEWENVMFTYGLPITQVGVTAMSQALFEENYPELAFEKFYNEVKRVFNIGFYIDYSGSKPKLVVDYWQNLFNEDLMYAAENIDELKEKTLVDFLYSKLDIGTTTAIQSGEFPGDITFIGFKEESFNIIGKCNIDRTFDLKGDYIVDTNVIEDAIVNGADAYDDLFFFIDCEPLSAGKHKAVKSNPLLGSMPPAYYNMKFTNSEICKRYLGFIPNSIVKLIGNPINEFLASSTVDQLNSTPAPGLFVGRIQFDNDYTFPNYDTDGAYGLTTPVGSPVSLANSVFTAPSGGLYTLNANINLTITTPKTFGQDKPYGTGRIVISRYDSLNVFIERVGQTKNWGAYNFAFEGYVTQLNFNITNTYNASAGDYFIVEVELSVTTNPPPSTVNWKINAGSTFACTAALTGGGTYQSYNPEDYSVHAFDFEYPISEIDFETIDSTPYNKLSFSRFNTPTKYGWIETVKMYHGTEGKAKLILTASHKLNNAN